MVRWERMNEYYAQAKELYERIEKNTPEPPLEMVVLPIVYRRFLAWNDENKVINTKISIGLGGALADRWPTFEDYFLPKDVSSIIKNNNMEIERAIERNNAAENRTIKSETTENCAENGTVTENGGDA
jgi:hypothetical protein